MVKSTFRMLGGCLLAASIPRGWLCCRRMHLIDQKHSMIEWDLADPSDRNETIQDGEFLFDRLCCPISCNSRIKRICLRNYAFHK